MADLVQFEMNEPVEVALKFPEPRLIETKFGGERAMYTLADERVMFLDTLAAAKIKALGVQPGDCFYIVKRKKGRLQEFEVFRDSDEPPAKPPIKVQMGEEVIRMMQQPIESHPTGKKLPPARDLAKVIDPRKFAGGENLEQQLEQSIAQVKQGEQADGTFAVETPRKPVAQAQAATPTWAQTLITQTNTLVDVYAATLEHASRHGIAVKPEDVRSLLVTTFIQLAEKGKRGRNAA